MRSLILAIAVVASGCTALLGLDKIDSTDRDNDNVPDSIDNCPDDANPDQSDFDHNGKGDVCDLCTDGGTQDVDHDGIPDGCDGCIGTGADVDHDGIDDGCDACIGSGQDVDHDGIDDACDSCIGSGMDLDHDQIDDACDSCVQKFTDLDADGIDDGCDPCVASPPGQDTDGDGIENACDPCPTGPQHDEDGDGKFDACDVCGVIKDAQQADLDGDGVGDKCDYEDGTPDVEVMDPFIAQNAAWFIDGSGWTLGNDVARLLSIPQSDRWLGNFTSTVTASTRVRFVLAGPNFLPGSVSVLAFDDTSFTAALQLACKVDTSGRVFAVVVQGGTTTIVLASTTVDTSATMDIKMAVDDSNKAFTCTVRELGSSSADITVTGGYAPIGLAWHPGIGGQRVDATFWHFDAIGPAP